MNRSPSDVAKAGPRTGARSAADWDIGGTWGRRPARRRTRPERTARCRLDGVKEVAELLNGMRDAGVIRNYALFGAMAQVRYTEAVSTYDVDLLVDLPAPERIDALGPIYQYCARLGWKPEGEAIRVGDWPVQFIQAFSVLTREAMEQADEASYEGVPFRVVRPDHLAAIALSVGRSKDFNRVVALLEAGVVDRDSLERLATRHGLTEKWTSFRRRFLDE